MSDFNSYVRTIVEQPIRRKEMANGDRPIDAIS